MQKILEEISINNDSAAAPRLLRVLVSRLRPPMFAGNNFSAIQLQKLTELLHQHPEYKEGLQRNILFIIHQSSVAELFSESGIITKGNFWSEFNSKLSKKFLPPLEDEHSLSRHVQYIFHERNDNNWIEIIADEHWEKFFHTLDFKLSAMPHKLKSQMFNALKILSYRVAALGLEKEINRKMLNGDELLSPFLLQNKEVYDLIMLLSTGLSSSELQDRFNNITELLHQCEINLAQIKEKTSISGTSLQQIFVITRIAQMLERMKTIIGLMDDANFKTSQLVSFFKKTIHTENNKNKLRELFSENISLLSYQIAEHKSQSGEHYIAQDRNEYLKFFYSACGGGIIISFVVLLKVMIHHAGYAPFWEAVMYSLNYAMGFILIHITGSTLATKQPAMTASTIARSLDIKASGRLTDETIALLFAKVFNTQTISFIGNLVMVFPLTALWVMLLETSTGKLFVTPNEAVAMLDANNPLRSLVWLYAAFTGFFLFLSGIISGYYDNKVVYEQIPQRIRHHPHLQKMLPEKILSAFANYMNHNMGSLLGNLALGFFLGTATFIGEILGWYYDIRHITISSGYFSIGVFEIHSILPWWEIAVVFIGVMGVGFVNFVVSFSLALYVALKSRNVSVKDYTNLVATILRYFFRYPMDFIIPPAQERRITEIEGKDYLNK